MERVKTAKVKQGIVLLISTNPSSSFSTVKLQQKSGNRYLSSQIVQDEINTRYNLSNLLRYLINKQYAMFLETTQELMWQVKIII